MEHLDLPKELARQCLDRMVDEGLYVKVRSEIYLQTFWLGLSIHA